MFVIFFVLLFHYAHVQCEVDGTERSMMWDNNRQDFVDLYSLPRFASLQEQSLATKQDLDVKDIAGKILKVAYYQAGDLVTFYENDTKVTGICGEIWNLLADHLNFTLVPVKSKERNFGIRFKNGSYSGLMGILDRNEAHVILRTGYYSDRMNFLDYTTPVWQTKFQLYIQPVYTHDNKWMFRVFELRIWCALIFLYLVLSLAGYVFQNEQYRNIKRNKNRKKTNEKSERFTFNDHVFYTYSIMCCQGYLPGAFHNQNKILMLSKSTFAWLVLLSFSSNLIYQMTNRIVTPPFNNFETLLNKTNYDVLIFKGSMIYEFIKKSLQQATEQSKNYNLLKRFHFLNESRITHETVCHDDKKYALLETQDKIYMKDKRFCPVIPMGKSYFQTWIGFGLSKRFPYKKDINISILKLHEVGLINVLKNRWLNCGVMNEKNKLFKTIDMEQVYLILCIPLIGTVLSLVMLSFENAIFFYQKKT